MVGGKERGREGGREKGREGEGGRGRGRGREGERGRLLLLKVFVGVERERERERERGTEEIFSCWFSLPGPCPECHSGRRCGCGGDGGHGDPAMGGSRHRLSRCLHFCCWIQVLVGEF